METTRVLVAVKSAALARVIEYVLHGETGISGMDFADSTQRLMEQALRLRPDLIIVNSLLLGRDSSVVLTRLRRANPQSKLILTCNFEEFAKAIPPGIVDARVLDERLVRQLPAIVRRLRDWPKARKSIVREFGLPVLFLLSFVASA